MCELVCHLSNPAVGTTLLVTNLFASTFRLEVTLEWVISKGLLSYSKFCFESGRCGITDVRYFLILLLLKHSLWWMDLYNCQRDLSEHYTAFSRVDTNGLVMHYLRSFFSFSSIVVGRSACSTYHQIWRRLGFGSFVGFLYVELIRLFLWRFVHKYWNILLLHIHSSSYFSCFSSSSNYLGEADGPSCVL